MKTRVIPGVGEIVTLTSALRGVGVPARTASRMAKRPGNEVPLSIVLGRRRYVVRAQFEDWFRKRLTDAGLIDQRTPAR